MAFGEILCILNFYNIKILTATITVVVLELRALCIVYSAKCRSHWPRDLRQCLSTVGPRPGTVPRHQLYRDARVSPGICHFSFLSNFHE